MTKTEKGSDSDNLLASIPRLGQANAFTQEKAAPPKKCKGRRVLFFNSIGGIFDTMAIPAVIQAYKKIFPEDTTVLYDALYLTHYYEKPDFIDQWVPAKEPIFPDHVPQLIESGDPGLPELDARTTRELDVHRIVATHQCHFLNRNVGPPEAVMEMEFDTTLASLLEGNFDSLGLNLKEEQAARVIELWRQFNPDDRPLAGIHIYADGPERSLSIPRYLYMEVMEELAEIFVENAGARILFTGDAKPRSKNGRYEKGDWVDLDALSTRLYDKLEILRRCDLFMGPHSPIWDTVNLMRGPEQTPALQIYTHPGIYGGRQRPEFRNYYPIGGRYDLPLVAATFRHPRLQDFVLHQPQPVQKIIEMVNFFGEEAQKREACSHD